jgi:hypothetical protein
LGFQGCYVTTGVLTSYWLLIWPKTARLPARFSASFTLPSEDPTSSQPAAPLFDAMVRGDGTVQDLLLIDQPQALLDGIRRAATTVPDQVAEALFFAIMELRIQLGLSGEGFSALDRRWEDHVLRRLRARHDPRPTSSE